MLEYWLWLSGRRGLGVRGLRALLEQFGTPEAVYCASDAEYPSDIRPDGRTSLADKELAPARQILQQCYRQCIHIVTLQDAVYPQRLKNIDDAPLVLYYQGVLPDFDAEPVIAMVGTRRASAYGLLQAKRLGYELGRYGGIVVSGGGQLGIFEKNGVKVGMTGYCFPYKGGKKDISADVKALREAGCQIVIASFHWGSEYRDDFTGEQRTIGRAAIRAGADIVVGTHPHIVQGIEAYQDSYILYSLGNLVFGGNVDPDDRDAYLARVTFTVYEDHCDAPELTVVPIRLTALDKGTDYRPVVADEADSARIFKRIMKLSSGMGDFVNGELTEGL